MRRTFLSLAVVFVLGIFTSPAKAQDGSFTDPFYLYYGFFLPRQAALAAQPQPEDYIRMNSAARQFSALTERSSLTDPIGIIGEEDLDPFRPFGPRSGMNRAKIHPTGITHSNLNGSGPPAYFNRVGSYHPSMRGGRGAGSRSSVVGSMSMRGGGMGPGGMSLPRGFSGGMPSMPGGGFR